MSKIMRVFYDNAGLPYKDSALSIHYPILEGGEFVGANNTTDIYFYTANLGDFYFVANCKLPNGALVDKLLVQGSDEFGDYFSLSLDSELTENKGHLKVALKGYGGNVNIEEEQDGDTTIVVINGTPTIVATGIVDIAINYAPLVHYISSLTPSEYEQLLGAIGSKLDITKGIYVIVDRTISATQFSEGQLVYSKADKLFYRVTSNAYVLEQVDIGSINVGGDTLSNRLSTLASDISDLEGDINDLDTNKADKIGALPHIIIPANTKVYQFINTHSLDNSPFVFILNNVPYFATMRTSGSFEIERCDNGQTLSAYRWTGTFDNNQTFEEIIVDANLDNYEQENNKVPSLSASSTNKQYPSAKCVYNVQQELTLAINSSGHSIVASINRTNYVMTIALKDAFGNTLGTAQDIDLPLESIVVSAEYYDTYTYGGVDYEKVIVITLETTPVPTIVPVGALVDGLVDEDTLNATLQPYIKSKVVNSVLTTGDLLTEFGVEKAFVLDVMGDILLCYINETENEGYYTMSVVGKNTAYTTQTFTNAELVTNILGTGTLEIDYLPIITLTTAMQTLNSDQLQVANQDNSVINYNNRLYHKSNDSGTSLEFVCIDYDIVDEGANQKLTKYEIMVNKSTGATSMITQLIEFYSKGESDALLDEKANVDGNYPTMTVGAADNLTPYGENSGVDGYTPFVMQTAGGSSDIGSQAYLKSLRGNSAAFNQLIRNGNFANDNYWLKSDSSITFNTSNNVATFTANAQYDRIYQNLKVNLIANHKYLIIAYIKLTTATDGVQIRLFDPNDDYAINTSLTTEWQMVSGIVTVLNSGAGVLQIRDNRASGFDAIQIKNVNLFDLTQMLGAGNEYTNALQFIRDYPNSYYEYNEGTLLSSKVNGIKNVGYNAYDKSNPNDYIRVINGQIYTLEGTYTDVELYDYNKNLLSDTFVSESSLPNNCCYLKLIGGSSNTCLHLTHDKSKVGYEEYHSETYPLPNIELRGFDDVYDEIKPNGTLITRIGVVDLGSIDWVAYGQGFNNLFRCDSLGIKGVASSQTAKVLITKLLQVVPSDYIGTTGYTDNTFAVNPDGRIYVNIPNITNVDDLKLALSGTYLLYELANYVTTQNDNYKFDELMPIDDFGTQEFLYDSNIAIPIPQGNDFFYPVDYKAFIDTLGNREDINYDASKIVSQDQLTDALDDIDLSGYAKIEEGLNVINASDIVNNTLTQAQYNLITNGKPTRIVGTFLGHYNILITNIFEAPSTFRLKYTCANSIDNFVEGYLSLTKANKAVSELTLDYTLTTFRCIKEINGKTIDYYLNNVYHYATNSTTTLQYETINNISISSDTTFTLATAPSNTYPEYKANITNSGASDITITLPSGTTIKGNVSISSNTFVIPAGSSVEVNIQNSKAIVVEW